MTIYMVCDGDGYALTDGLQEHEAHRMAQSMANDRGERVWLSSYELDADSQPVSNDDDEEIEPC